MKRRWKDIGFNKRTKLVGNLINKDKINTKNEKIQEEKGMKKKWALALALGMMVSSLLTACGNTKEVEMPPLAGEESAGDTAAKETGDVPEASDGAETAGETTLVFWSIGLKLKDDSGIKMPEELAANQYIARFEEEHPGVTVEVIDQPVDGIHDLFKAANISQEGPDVIGLWSGTATNEYKDNLLALDGYMTEEELDMYTGLNLCKKDFQEDGEVIALPYNVTTYNVFYNKEYFAQAGIEELPTTFDELLAVCEQLKAADIQPFLVGDSSGESTTWVSSEFMIDLVGTDDIVNFGTESLPFDCDEYKDSLNKWCELFGKDYTNKDFATLSAWDSIQRFVTGEGAMNINGSWAIGEMEPIMGENLGTFKIPAISADAPFGDFIVSQPGANVSVTSYSKNKELAVEFIKYMTSADFEGAAHLDTGDLPANNRVDVSIITNPISQEAYSWVKENKAGIGYDSIISVETANELYKLAPTMLAGKMTPDQLIDKLKSLQ